MFMDKLFTFIKRLPKNKYELKKLEKQNHTIGRVLDTSWVSSSAKTVEAVLKKNCQFW